MRRYDSREHRPEGLEFLLWVIAIMIIKPFHFLQWVLRSKGKR